MKLGLQLGYWGAQPNPFAVSLAQEAERLGFDSVWTAEAWGSDAFTPLAWIGAHTERIRLCTGIVQISARTPASCAMHALTLDHLSNGRFSLGLGVSGPAGGRGLVRPAVRQAAGAHARVRRHRPARAAARGAGRVRRASTTGCRTTARTRGGSASRCARSRTRCAPTCRSCSAPKARRTSRSRPRSPTVGCRSTTRRSGPRCTRIRCARAKPGLRDLRDRDGLRDHRRRRGRPDAHQGRARVLHRRHGREGSQLPHGADEPHGLRGRGAPHPGAVLRGQARRSDPARARPSSPTRSRSSVRRNASATACRRGRRARSRRSCINGDLDTLRAMAELVGN